MPPSKWIARISTGLAAGIAIVYIDNYAFGGEVSPIIIVIMLLAATITAGVTWGRNGATSAIATWVCIPSAHFVKHIFGMPDTLHPNTYLSILYLAVFTLAVAISGTVGGVLIRTRLHDPDPIARE